MTTLLMTPGPTRVPERVLAAGAVPMLHHRSAEFSALLVETLARIRPLFGATGDVLPVHASGRGALEAAVTNLFSPGDEVVACCNGRFGEMWAEIAARFGLVVHRVCGDWTASADPGEVDAALDAHPAARAVMLPHSDTSTGVLNDIAGVSAAARRTGALVMVDAVSSIGGTPFWFDEWGVDVAITASQKCLMSSPGLSFVAMSARAWEARASSSMPRSYFDLLAIKNALARARPETPGTTPVHIVAQVHDALGCIHDEGLANVYARHEQMAQMARQRVARLGLTLQCPSLARFSPTLTAIRAPEPLAPAAIREQMRARGILVARGLGRFESTCFRVGHMGDIRPDDVRHTFDVLEDVLV